LTAFLGIALATAMPAGQSARADVAQCIPITVDGTSVACMALSSTSETNDTGDTTTTVTATVQPIGLPPISQSQSITTPYVYVPESCSWTPAGPTPYWDFAPGNGRILLSAGVASLSQPSPSGGRTCSGLAVVTYLSASWVHEPYHVPEVCVTTECVGPYDGSVDERVLFSVGVCIYEFTADYGATSVSDSTPVACRQQVP